MNGNLPIKISRDVLKMLDLEHLNADEFQLLGERRLDKDSMCWAVRHLSECRRCCRRATVLSEREIEDALAGTPYSKAGFVEQTISHYFYTLKKK